MTTKSNPLHLPDNLGRVFWITGLAGSGKSTIAKQLALELRFRGEKIINLDGDSIRETIAEDLGHSVNDRLRLARRYGRICKMLSDQGAWVVSAFMALFHEVQRWNRANIGDYTEIFVSVPMSELILRDQKGLYSSAMAGKIKNVVGVNITPEFPECPDLVVENYGSETADDSVAKILSRFC